MEKSRQVEPLFWTFVGLIFTIWTVSPLQKAKYSYGVQFQVLIQHKSWKILERCMNCWMHALLLQYIPWVEKAVFFFPPSNLWITWASNAMQPYTLFKRPKMVSGLNFIRWSFMDCEIFAKKVQTIWSSILISMGMGPFFPIYLYKEVQWRTKFIEHNYHEHFRVHPHNWK